MRYVLVAWLVEKLIAGVGSQSTVAAWQPYLLSPPAQCEQ